MSVLGAIGLLVMKELIAAVANYFGKKNKESQDTALAINTLTIKVANMDDKLDQILRLKEDVSSLHEKMRIISSKIERPLSQ